jgi:ferritin-like metal-binding protein YciE
MADRSIETQLTKYLTDVHSIEEQALTQMRRAPGIAGDPELAIPYQQHLPETERQEARVRELLEARHAEPSALKDLAGKAGGLGMAAFAKLNPDTPGKLTAHAFSYEHMEVAAYELLRRVAERAGESEVAAASREIAAEEREMAARLESSFDRAVEVSLREVDPDDLGSQLDSYLADAHAIEAQAVQMLEAAPKLVEDEPLAALYRSHLEETRSQQERVRARLEARGSSPSRFQDAGMRIGALNLGGFFGAQPDTTAKLAGFSFAFEHLEIAAYELLRRVAERAGDAETAQLATAILAEERAAAEGIEACFDSAIDTSLAKQGVAPVSS